MQKWRMERGGDEKRILRVLELCAVSGAFSSAVERICKKLGLKCKVYRLDIDSRGTVEIVADIEKWTCQFKKGFFDIIWCSPPCTNYSNAKTVGKRNLASADRVAKSCVAHIDNLAPFVFFIENPRARLRKRPFMRRFLKLTHICTQCKYGRRFKKETDICTKICAEDLQLQRCNASSPCVHVKRFEKRHGKKRHPQSAQTCGTYDKDLKITIPGTPSKKSAEIAPKLA